MLVREALIIFQVRHSRLGSLLPLLRAEHRIELIISGILCLIFFGPKSTETNIII